MITKEEALDIITVLNDEANTMAWDSWAAADESEESDDEEDWARSEEMREEASHEQSGYFRASFHNLPQEQQDEIWKYAKDDEEFADDFSAWYGEQEFEEKIGEVE